MPSNQPKSLLFGARDFSTHPKLRMRSLGSDDSEVGSSSMWLLKRLRISRLTRSARLGGMRLIRLWLRLSRVRLVIRTAGITQTHHQ